MTERSVLTLILLLVGPVYGQQPNIVRSAPSSAGMPAAGSNAVPMTAGQAAITLIEGVNEVQEKTRDAVNAGMDIRRVQGIKVDPRLSRIMDKVDLVGDAAGTIVEGAQIYREYGSEGMEVFTWVRGTELAVDNAINVFAPSVAPAWRLSRQAGEVIRAIPSPWTGRTLQDVVTDIYFDNLYGRKVDEAFERNTSDEAIEQHRQKLRQQRFENMSVGNSQAAANRAASIAEQPSGSIDPALVNGMMLMLLPSAVAASQQRPAQPTLPAQVPGASAIPEQPRCTSDGRRVGTNEWGPTYCWPTTSGAGMPTARAPVDLPALGSTFGSVPQPPVSPPKSGTRPACSPFDRWWMGKEWDKKCK